MNPPPNPHDDEARAAMREAIRPTLVNPPANDAPPEPSLSTGLDRIVALWPDMARYYRSARIERLQHTGGWYWGVTVTIFEREPHP